MAIGQVIITQIGGVNFDYCRRDNTGAGSFDDYDTEALSRVGTEKLMWEDTADIMYWGADAVFYNIGFGKFPSVTGDYGVLVWKYYDGTIWRAFAPFHESTSGFSQDGYIAWDILNGSNPWTATTVDSQSAFWIRATVTSVDTAAKFYSFLLNVTLDAQLVLAPVYEQERLVPDVNGVNQLIDLPYTGPTRATIECTLPSLGMADLNVLWYWLNNRKKLHIEDQAQTTTPDPDNDAPFKDYTGYLVNITGPAASPAKMRPESYTLEFVIEGASALLL